MHDLGVETPASQDRTTPAPIPHQHLRPEVRHQSDQGMFALFAAPGRPGREHYAIHCFVDWPMSISLSLAADRHGVPGLVLALCIALGFPAHAHADDATPEHTRLTAALRQL